MILLVATTWPFAGAAMVVAVDNEFKEVEELAAGKPAEPETWLARAVLGTLMVFNLSTRSMAMVGPVFMRIKGAWAIS